MSPQKPYRPRTPDRTGMLISPGSTFLGLAILAAILVRGAVAAPGHERHVLLQMLESLSRALGLGGSIAVAAAMLVPSGIWLARAIGRYRAKVREDRRAIGLPT